MSSSQGALATVARDSALPAEAQQTVQTFLELYEGLPASARVLQQLCDAIVDQTTTDSVPMATKNLTATTRVVLEWSFYYARTNVSVSFQKWTSDREPWTGDVFPPSSRPFTSQCIASQVFEKTPEGMMQAITYAKKVWESAQAGPCDQCLPQHRPVKRMRLSCSGMCAACTLRKAILH